MAVVLAVPALVTFGVSPATSAPGSGFESTDGDMVTNSTYDWDALQGRGIPVSSATDKLSGGTDDSLGMGSKDDDQTFNVTTGSIPNNKSDLDRFYVATEHTAANEDLLYLAWTRNNTLGTANMSIELNQLVQPAPPATGPWALRRTAGDLLVLFDFAQGGKASAVKLSLSKWVTSGTARTVCQASNSVPCWGKVTALGSTVADGSVNLTPITDPLNGNKALPALTFGEAAVNLTRARVLNNPCAGFGSAMIRSRASAAFNSELKDFIAPISVSIEPTPNPAGAVARGTATPASVNGSKIPASAPAQSSQTGPGNSSAEVSAGPPVRVPSDGSLLSADLLNGRSTSTVGPGSGVSTVGADQTSLARAVNVNVDSGLVTADVVQAVASTHADHRSASFDSIGSTFKNLKVRGVAMNDVAPNTRVDLPALAFGNGSFVLLYALGPDPVNKTGTTSQPGAVGQSGTYAADLTVRMIQVHITGSLVVPALDVIVSDTTAHSEYKGVRCHDNEVSGHAFIASATVPDLTAALVGYVAIPTLGGAQSQHADSVSLGSQGSLLTAATADSSSTGEVSPDDNVGSHARSTAVVQDICALASATGCLVSATVVSVSSESTARTGLLGSTGSFTILNAKVAGTPVSVDVPNQSFEIPGVGVVTFNERVCDSGAALPTCASGRHTGLTVRGIHIVVTVPIAANPLGLKSGTEVVIGEAHSDATF